MGPQPHLPWALFKPSPGPFPLSELCCSLGAVNGSWAIAISSSEKGHNFFNCELKIVGEDFWVVWHFIPALEGHTGTGRVSEHISVTATLLSLMSDISNHLMGFFFFFFLVL